MTTSIPNRPIALTIAGSDSSGGAGIQADLKTFAANGVYGASAITALTAQNTVGVQAVHTPPSDFVGQQLESVLSDLKVAAVKTGMLANQEIIETVLDKLNKHSSIPLIADPVMIATSGDPLLAPDAIDTIRKSLLPRAKLLTPNLAEAARLLQCEEAATREEMISQGQKITDLGCHATLIKGGHFGGSNADDVLVLSDGSHEWFSVPKVKTHNTHGTGCTLSAAIAAHLAHGEDLVSAIGSAKTYLTRALKAGAGQNIGHGHGPVDHLV